MFFGEASIQFSAWQRARHCAGFERNRRLWNCSVAKTQSEICLDRSRRSAAGATKHYVVFVGAFVARREVVFDLVIVRRPCRIQRVSFAMAVDKVIVLIERKNEAIHIGCLITERFSARLRHERTEGSLQVRSCGVRGQFDRKIHVLLYRKSLVQKVFRLDMSRVGAIQRIEFRRLRRRLPVIACCVECQGKQNECNQTRFRTCD